MTNKVKIVLPEIGSEIVKTEIEATFTNKILVNDVIQVIEGVVNVQCLYG
jgi:hypothetical protein